MTPQGEQEVSPETIVVGIDGSPASRLALDWALEQARIEGRSLTLVHAIHALTPVWQEPGAPDPTTAHRRALLRKGTELLEEVLPESSSARSGVDVHHVVRIGDPCVVLPEVSAIAALVVVGSRGRGPLRSLLLGSTAVALVRHARCPVVVPSGAAVPECGAGCIGAQLAARSGDGGAVRAGGVVGPGGACAPATLEAAVNTHERSSARFIPMWENGLRSRRFRN